MVKRKDSGKMDSHGYCGGCRHGCIKFTSIAFILFLITVWPALMDLVQSIHWGWFLSATILLSLSHWKYCKSWCKK